MNPYEKGLIFQAFFAFRNTSPNIIHNYPYLQHEQDFLAKAWTELGNWYYVGEVIEQDYVKALEPFEKAANNGNIDAMYNVGGMHFHGQGTEENEEKAKEWYDKAVEAGSTYAWYE